MNKSMAHFLNKNQPAEDNLMSYDKLGWILDYSDEGFFLLIASEKMQEKHSFGSCYF